MSDKAFPGDDPTDYSTARSSRSDQWRGNSPWDAILEACDKRSISDRRLNLDALLRKDFLGDAWEAAKREVLCLRQLYEVCGSRKMMIRNGESTRALLYDALEHFLWFCSCTHGQVITGDWDAVEALREELASVRPPVQIDQRFATSITEFVMRRHCDAVLRMDRAHVGEFFDEAMSFVPEGLRGSGGTDSANFAITVASATFWPGRLQALDKDEPVGSEWLNVYARLRGCDALRQQAEHLAIELVISFVGSKLKVFRGLQRILAGLQGEFTHAAAARLAAGSSIADVTGSRDRDPEWVHNLSRLNRKIYEFMEHRGSARLGEFAEYVWGEKVGEGVTQKNVQVSLSRFNNLTGAPWALLLRKGVIKKYR
ncbi:MAG TPA: hypothetical protein VKU02_24025 [Gemmataceae bacterium]|nr:hypothetical protein [Gemmataceae bacterium]